MNPADGMNCVGLRNSNRFAVIDTMKFLPLVFSCFLFLNPCLGKEKKPWPDLRPAETNEPLPGTELLEMEGDLSRQLVDANDAFLDRQIEATAEERRKLWTPGSYDPNDRRKRLAAMLGMDRDERKDDVRLEYFSTRKSQLAVAEGLSIYNVRWRTLDGVDGEGLLLEPDGKDHPILADVIAIPDADQIPEEIAGLTTGDSRTSPYALLLAQAGCRVLVPALVNRSENEHRMTNREWLHRPAFELGRHLLGYELAMVLTGADAMKSESRPLGVIGWGEGGLLALYAGALDKRFDVVSTSGYFGPRESLWREPAEHNVFGLLEMFGDAEIASLVAPRLLIIETGDAPDFSFRGEGSGGIEILADRPELRGKPGRFSNSSLKDVNAEFSRISKIADFDGNVWQVESDRAIGPKALEIFSKELGLQNFNPNKQAISFEKIYADPKAERQVRLATQIDRFNQRALVLASKDRGEFFSDLNTSSLEAFEESIEPYRDIFREEVIGDFEIPLDEPNPRSRPFQENETTISYEVVLDVFDGVFSYGILTLPKTLSLSSGEKCPVVVCQHGLEGTPQQVIGEEKYKAYKAFATRLAERGFITFAPQNGYKYFDHFRLQQFKAQSIGKTLFSIIVPQHRQITDWLAAQPFVDGEKIAFYGLSYGGKSAMRIPPLVDRYCLSICSADFNDWVWKNAATDPESLRYSYANKGEYEIFEWNLGGTFNYSEMAALICPRPFMVERGHFDGVAPDERVALEFAKVRHLYQAKLGIGDRCEIEWFAGPHSINAEGTFRFLHRHLDWPEP